jgi:hypothetical protein
MEKEKKSARYSQGQGKGPGGHGSQARNGSRLKFDPNLFKEKIYESFACFIERSGSCRDRNAH